MIEFNLTLLRVKLQKEGKDPLWEHVESCWLRSKGADYHLSAIKKKLEEVKDWPNHENSLLHVFEIEWVIGHEVDALMLALHSLIDITAQVIGGVMAYEFITKSYWDELKKKGIPDNFSNLINVYRGDAKWKTIVNYSNVTKHIKNIGGTLDLGYMEENVGAGYQTNPVRDRQLPQLDICKFEELTDFINSFVKEVLKLVVKQLWPNSKEIFDTPTSWSVSMPLTLLKLSPKTVQGIWGL